MSLARNFIIELSTERLAFVPFYHHIQKQLCQEVMDFFLAAYYYRTQPAGLRLINEKIIYNHFISRKSKKQVNLAEKLLKRIEENIGKGLSNVFDEALFHCAESLATNYWLDFTKSESFKNITRKKKGSDISLPFGDDALKKAMKKGNIPGYIFDAAFGFFNGEEVSTKTKLKDCESFETWFFGVKHQILVGHIMTMCKADSDRAFCNNLLTLLYDRPKTIFHLFQSIAEETVTPEILKLTEKFSAFKADEKKKKDSKEILPKIDPFNVNEDSYSAFFFRYYLTRCFDESWAPSLTKLINDVYKFDVVDGSLKSYMTPIEQVLKAIKNDLEGRPCEKWRMKLLFQALFNVAYPRYKEDKNAVLHAIGTVIIEHVCHCLEYPVHMGIEIVDGVRVRPNVALIVNMLRNYAYSQNVYPTAKDKDLHELWLSNSAIVDFMKWLGSMVQVGFAKKEICIAVNESIDIFYENFFAPGIVREIDFVAKHFVSKQDLIKPNMTSDNDKDIVSFLTKNADYCAKVAGMKFES